MKVKVSKGETNDMEGTVTTHDYEKCYTYKWTAAGKRYANQRFNGEGMKEVLC